MPTQFNVQDIRVLKVHYSITAKNGGSGAEKKKKKSGVATSLPAELRCRSTYQEKKLLLKSIVGVSLQSPFFSLDVEIGGAFKFSTTPDVEDLDKLRHINCPAIVFPFLREFVADLIRRAGFDNLLLPPVNFLKMFQDKKAEEAKEKPEQTQ